MQGTNAHAILSHSSHDELIPVMASKQLPWTRSRHWVLPPVGTFLSSFTTSLRTHPGTPPTQTMTFAVRLGMPSGPALMDLAVSGRPTLSMSTWAHLSSAATHCLCSWDASMGQSRAATSAASRGPSEHPHMALTNLQGGMWSFLKEPTPYRRCVCQSGLTVLKAGLRLVMSIRQVALPPLHPVPLVKPRL